MGVLSSEGGANADAIGQLEALRGPTVIDAGVAERDTCLAGPDSLPPCASH